jgi:SAM-dependent methyltransferase
MANYRTDRLVGVDATAFRARIDAFLALTDHAMEGFDDPAKQRDPSIRFRWGHDHDFGAFELSGAMGDRHLTLLARFVDDLKALPLRLDGRRVLDIGAWTGGTSLVLAAMGAEVVAVEEVAKYADCLLFLKEAFDVSSLTPRTLSLYECTGPDFEGGFDVVLFAGVLYHVTDPIVALRITFNALRDGGSCLVESAASHSPRRLLSYEGLGRPGWNWFIPSVPALVKMMKDVGFTGVRTRPTAGSRAFAVGRRAGTSDMLRAGLSRRDLP